MRLGLLKFDKNALLSAPCANVQLFLALANATNEINALFRLVVWTADYSSPSQVIVHGQVALSYIFIRLLAGKLNEANNIIRNSYQGSQLSRSYNDHLPSEAQEALHALNDYFGRPNNPIREIRNRLFFHYDTAELVRPLHLVNEELIAYLQEVGSVNNLYYLAEVLAGMAAVALTSKAGIPEALDDLHKALTHITTLFTFAADAIISEFIRRNPDVTVGYWGEVPLPELQPTLEVRVPWFTDNSGPDEPVA